MVLLRERVARRRIGGAFSTIVLDEHDEAVKSPPAPAVAREAEEDRS